MLLAVDPGTRSPGVAIFNDGAHTVLMYAERVSVSVAVADLPDGERWLYVAYQIAAWASARGPIDTVVFERPQWYARAKSKGDPNQLAGVAGVAANVTGLLSARSQSGLAALTPGLRVMSPTPAEWIGQLPKTCPTCGANKKKCPMCRGSAWETPRGRRIRSRLTADELAIVPDQNDAIDAVGLGLWALGRLERRCVFSNGRD